MGDRTITMTVGHDRLATVGSDRRLLNMLRIPGQKKTGAFPAPVSRG
jgi:hypothetical protein